jgi:hypothetical protein
MIAKGTFDVTLHPEPPYDDAGGIALGRVHIDKKFTSGPLDATSTVEMLGARTKVPTSAGYVAIERISGSLEGKRGTFVMQHSGSMHGGAMSLSVTIVPDSGTNELEGIRGSMKIDIEDKQHFYELDYSFG